MSLARIDSHAVTGVVPPQQQEAMIREVWETVAANGPAMTLARKLIGTIILPRSAGFSSRRFGGSACSASCPACRS